MSRPFLVPDNRTVKKAYKITPIKKKNNDNVNIFEDSQYYRNVINNNLSVKPIEKFNGPGYLVIWLTKICNVGCDFCFFHSKATEIKNKNNSIMNDGIKKTLEFLNESKIKKTLLSGGGEPFLMFNEILEIIKDGHLEEIVIATSGLWGMNSKICNERLQSIREAFTTNNKVKKVIIRISLDSYHSNKIDSELGYIKNIINAFHYIFPTIDGVHLEFRCIKGDKVVDKMKNLPEVLSIEDSDQRHQKINLIKGGFIMISYNDEFICNENVDLNNEIANAAATSLRDFNINSIYHGNMGVTRFSEKCGLNLELMYDGTIMPRGGASPDNELSLYNLSFNDFLLELYKDVITLTFLEKGNYYRDCIISEISPETIKKAKATGLRDFYGRITLEEEKIRLYFVIRSIQDYISEGRISPEELSKLPIELQKTIELNKDDLIKKYRLSKDNIIYQYIRNGKVDLIGLNFLYNKIKSLHYDVAYYEISNIIESSSIDETIKKQFLNFFEEDKKNMTINLFSKLKKYNIEINEKLTLPNRSVIYRMDSPPIYWSKTREILINIPKDYSVLEIGSGLGDISFLIKSLGFKNTIGIERDCNLSKIANEKNNHFFGKIDSIINLDYPIKLGYTPDIILQVNCIYKEGLKTKEDMLKQIKTWCFFNGKPKYYILEVLDDDTKYYNEDFPDHLKLQKKDLLNLFGDLASEIKAFKTYIYEKNKSSKTIYLIDFR